METILIMAQALQTAGKLDIMRLDINYNDEEDIYTARVWFKNEKSGFSPVFDITERGEVRPYA